jgi:hypothetical protein
MSLPLPNASCDPRRCSTSVRALRALLHDDGRVINSHQSEYCRRPLLVQGHVCKMEKELALKQEGPTVHEGRVRRTTPVLREPWRSQQASQSECEATCCLPRGRWKRRLATMTVWRGGQAARKARRSCGVHAGTIFLAMPTQLRRVPALALGDQANKRAARGCARRRTQSGPLASARVQLHNAPPWMR